MIFWMFFRHFKENNWRRSENFEETSEKNWIELILKFCKNSAETIKNGKKFEGTIKNKFFFLEKFVN